MEAIVGPFFNNYECNYKKDLNKRSNQKKIKYVITITSKTIKLSQTKIRCKYKIEHKYIKQDIDF